MSADFFFEVFYLLSAVCFGCLLWRRPYLLLRPSIWFALGMMIRINAAAVWGADQWSARLADGILFRGLTLAFPLGIILWVLATPRFSQLAGNLSSRCRAGPFGRQAAGSGWAKIEKRMILILGAWAVLTMVVYLREVPLLTTGLATIFLNPVMATAAREESLKLLDADYVQYLFMWHTTVVALALFPLLAQRLRFSLSLKNVPVIAFMFLLWVSVMLTGARYPGGALMMALGLVLFLRLGRGRGALLLGIVGFAPLFLATALTIFREGQINSVSFELVGQIMTKSIFRRVFVIPFETGVWTNIMAQEHGLFGISSIRPLASLFGVGYVNMPNMVGMTFLRDTIASVNAATCFLFHYQASFGLWPGWFLSLGLVCGLDFLLPAFRKLRGPLLVSFLAAFMVDLMVLVGANFTTGLMSHGIGLIALLAFLVGEAGDSVNRRGERHPCA